MASTYYTSVLVEMEDRQEITFIVAIRQFGEDKIVMGEISIVGVLEGDSDKLGGEAGGDEVLVPEGTSEEIIKLVFENITLEQTLAMRIDQTKLAIDKLKVEKKEPKTFLAIETQNPEALNKAYASILDPEYFVTLFTDTSDFRGWCREGSIQDLECVLVAFEKAEVYEHCMIVSEVLKEKKMDELTK